MHVTWNQRHSKTERIVFVSFQFENSLVQRPWNFRHTLHTKFIPRIMFGTEIWWFIWVWCVTRCISFSYKFVRVCLRSEIKKNKNFKCLWYTALKSNSFWLSKIYKGVALFDCIHSNNNGNGKDLFEMQSKSSVYLSLCSLRFVFSVVIVCSFWIVFAFHPEYERFGPQKFFFFLLFLWHCQCIRKRSRCRILITSLCLAFGGFLLAALKML